VGADLPEGAPRKVTGCQYTLEFDGPDEAPHRDLVSQHEDLDVLGDVGAGEQREPAQHSSELRESSGHAGRSCCAGPRQ
jgi:hypothetical protein